MTMCNNYKCDCRYQCFRYTSPPGVRQSFYMKKIEEIEKCEDFMKTYHKINSQICKIIDKNNLKFHKIFEKGF